ncbi:hypothetical protein ADUPG1_004809, partial [Aduncisulcus paluster]
YVDAKDVVERCAVRAAPGILYSIAAYRILSEVEFDDKFCQQLYLCTEKFCIKFAEYLFQGTAKGRDMELFSVALLNFGFCNAAREQIKKMSDICYTTVTDVTIEQLLEKMATISTKMYQNITGYKSEEYKAGYIIPKNFYGLMKNRKQKEREEKKRKKQKEREEKKRKKQKEREKKEEEEEEKEEKEEEEEEKDDSHPMFSFCGTSVTDCDHGQCYLRGCNKKGADIVLKTTTGEKFNIEV